MSSDKPRIGFIGLGLMGHGIAKNLVNKGFPLTVRLHRNRKPAEDILAAGAKEVKTSAELARRMSARLWISVKRALARSRWAASRSSTVASPAD